MRGRAARLIFFAGLFVLTLAAYRPAWHGGRLWDDDAHLTGERMQTVHGLGRIWTSPGATQQYYPIAHSAFWLMHQAFGNDTLGYHLVNITLHALSACLIAILLRRLGVPGWWLAGAVFALHPVHVESVAWMSELKNVLSGVFYLSAALVYLKCRLRSRATTYAAALVLFIVALLAKSVTATLPAALLVVFWWQQGRLDWRKDAVPLVPFLVIGIGAGVMTAWMEHTYIGAHGGAFELTMGERVLIAGRAIWFYLAKLVWPVNLTFIYPRWNLDTADWLQWLWPALTVGFTAALWRIRTWSRAPLAAWLLFAGTLTPALGFINVYPFRYSFVADHFQYLASISVIALVCAAIRIGAGRLGAYGWHAAMTVAVIIVATLGTLTWRQSSEYIDGETLYRATLERNPDCWMAYNNLGVIKMATSPADAIVYFSRVIELNPMAHEAHTNLAYAHLALGQVEDGAREAEQAVRAQPQSVEARVALGSALIKLGRFRDAAEEFRRAVDLKPESAEAHANYGNTLSAIGDLPEAIIQLEMAIVLKPDMVQAHVGLGEALLKAGRREEAASAFREALRLQPDLQAAREGLLKAEGRN